MMQRWLLLIFLVIAVDPLAAANLFSNPTALTFAFGSEKGIDEVLFKLQNVTAIIELKYHPNQKINNLETQMAFSVWSINPQYNEKWRTGLAIRFDELSPIEMLADAKNNNGQAFLFTRYDFHNGTIKVFIPVVKKSEGEIWPYEIRLENVRHYFKDTPKFSLALSATLEYNTQSGFWKSVGFYAKKENFELQILSDSFSFGWLVPLNF